MSAACAVPSGIDGARLVDRAFRHVAAKIGASSPSEAASKVREGDLDAYLYFRYGIAREAAAEIASICDGVNAGLLFLENRCESFPGEPVLLGLLVVRKTAALRSLVDAIGEAVRHEVAARVPALASFDTVLATEIIDDEQVMKRSGVAALMNSVNDPPIQVWPQSQ